MSNINSDAKKCESLYKELQEINEKLDNSSEDDLTSIIDCVSRGIEVSGKLKERFTSLKKALNDKFENN